MNNFDWISKWASYTPDKKAVFSVDTGRVYSFQKLNEAALKVGSYLQNRFSLRKGDRIAVLAEHSPEYLMLFIAAQRLGFILVPLNFRGTVTELAYCIDEVEPMLILADFEAFEEKSVALKEKYPNNCKDFLEFFRRSSRLEVNFPESEFVIENDQPVFVFYTSGTTGKPKGVIYTNKMMFWNSLNTSVQLEITSGDHTINALPPYHTSGWNVLLLPMLHRGARVDFIKKFKPKKILKYLEQEPVTLFLAVPTMLRMMIRSNKFESFRSGNLKYIVVGGEPLPLPVIDAWAAKGILLSQGYGLTEAGPSITSLHYHDALWKKGSVGKPNFYVDLKILDDNGDEVRENEVGELCISGNIVTPGYWNNTAYTLEKIRDKWLHTGDLVKRDQDGFLYLVGRKNQMYISGGENIYPAEVEAVLYESQEVQEAAVVGVDHSDWGEIGVAFVVLRERFAEACDLLDHLKTRLASYKIPKDIIYLDALPKSGIGKVNRQKLKELYYDFKNEQRSII